MICNLLLLMGICLAQGAAAVTVYVQDMIYVPLRGGASDQHRIIHRGIPSDTMLELLESDEESGFSRVLLQNGTEGWLRTRYISEQPTARMQLKKLERLLAGKENERLDVMTALDSSQSMIARLEAENNSLQQNMTALKTELAQIKTLSADTIKLDEDNHYLKNRNRLLADELDLVTRMNAGLQDTRDQRWFLAGAGTLLLGLLPGFLLARRIYHRRTSGWN